MGDDHDQHDDRNGLTVIPDRFNGPPTTANGGYACGMAAELVRARLGAVEAGTTGASDDGAVAAVEATLHHPPPLGQPLRASVDGDTLALHDDETLVLTARPATLEPPAQAPVSLPDALHAAGTLDLVEYQAHHPFPTCFTCGPVRGEGDGLRIFPGPVDGRPGVVAWPWTPGAATADDLDLVAVPVIWAALDCPSGTARFAGGSLASVNSVLGRMTTTVHARPAAGQELVVGGWTVSEQGRKALAGSAIWSAEGQVLAESRSVWITLDENQLLQFGVAP